VATLDAIPASEQAGMRESGAQLAVKTAPVAPTFMYVTTRAAEALLGAPVTSPPAGRTVSGSVRFVDSPAPEPARNVVAILRGSDLAPAVE